MKKIADAFDRYVLELRKTAVDEKTEHMDRASLQALLQAIADASNPGVAVQHEPKRVAEKGAPDFKITWGGAVTGPQETGPIRQRRRRDPVSRGAFVAREAARGI